MRKCQRHWWTWAVTDRQATLIRCRTRLAAMSEADLAHWGNATTVGYTIDHRFTEPEIRAYCERKGWTVVAIRTAAGITPSASTSPGHVPAVAGLSGSPSTSAAASSPPGMPFDDGE